jgi:hypothetical protein
MTAEVVHLVPKTVEPNTLSQYMLRQVDGLDEDEVENIFVLITDTSGGLSMSSLNDVRKDQFVGIMHMASMRVALS